MKTRIFVIIDDKDHALIQIEHELSEEERSSITLTHFRSFRDFKLATLNEIDVVFLDFFLTVDGTCGIVVLPSIVSKFPVCFSSKRDFSDAMYNDAVSMDQFSVERTFSVEKIKATLENRELRIVLDRIFELMNVV